MLDSNLSWGGVLDFVDISMMVQIVDRLSDVKFNWNYSVKKNLSNSDIFGQRNLAKLIFTKVSMFRFIFLWKRHFFI